MFEEFFSSDDFSHASLWKEGGFIWDPLLYLKDYLKKSTYKIEISSDVEMKNQVSIGKGTVIDPGVYIEGPCIIGKNCIIRHGAFLRAGTILGDGCIVGHASEIKNSILMDGSVASHFCYVGDSILGPKVNLGAGVKCANMRLDQRKINVRLGGKEINTGLQKFGSILGEGVQVGCNCVLNPGTLIGKEAIIYPLLNIGGNISPKKEVKS